MRSASGLADGALVVFDTGGGSSQFTFGDGTRVDRQFSVNVGAVRYTERFHLDQAVPPAVVTDAGDRDVPPICTALDGMAPPDALVGMGGAVTNSPP